MKRRDALSALSGAIAGPLLARAQAPRPAGKIGYLHPRTVAPDSPTVAILRGELNRLGYVYPESILMRSGESDPARLPELARDLVRNGAGVLIAVGPAAVKAASYAGNTPVVAIDLESDPIRGGLAASFGRPGGNVTGLFVDQPSLAGKMIELLKEAAPKIERVAIVRTPSSTPDQVEAAANAARIRGLAVVVAERREDAGYDAAFRGFAGQVPTGVVQLGTPGFILDSKSFAAAAERHLLPSIAFLKVYVKLGVLMSYGPNNDLYFARAAVLADRILKGEKAGELPIEQPTHFELAINLQTARALKLTLPDSLLLQADEVME